MAAPRVLIVEDEGAVREMLHYLLMQEGLQVSQAENAEQALEKIAANPPSLILLDWMLPGMDGIELAASLKKRAETKQIPIIMLTARSEEDDKVKGLERGADDFVTKPFSARELIARIRAVLRRVAPQESEELVEVGDLTLDPSSHRVIAKGCSVDLGPTEFRLLHFFMTHRDRVYSRTQLLDWVWGTNVYIEERTVDVHIRRLRKALETSGQDQLVQTVRGVGYRFSERD